MSKPLVDWLSTPNPSHIPRFPLRKCDSSILSRGSPAHHDFSPRCQEVGVDGGGGGGGENATCRRGNKDLGLEALWCGANMWQGSIDRRVLLDGITCKLRGKAVEFKECEVMKSNRQVAGEKEEDIATKAQQEIERLQGQEAVGEPFTVCRIGSLAELPAEAVTVSLP
ncbi:hypothetical protein K504DRAFT_446120 [Pleomassaria siparia CBS 279.74]|uniref:Uncharacterized protein n=1 Tax=Pleomassaria siparia CBS 279.74 TaxID=1314801 RepID=A0A6G1KQR8_9PLEO|nr:hypothetical protein K504DRAFT_446120 [Pleomassaria siparia CBS 279.74]